MKIYSLLLITLISLFICELNAQENKPYKMRKDAIEKILVAINKNSPHRLDNVSEQIGANYDEIKNIFSYQIRLMDRVKDSIDIKLFNQVFTKHVNINSKKEPLTLALLEAKVIVEYRFFDRDKKQITSIKIYPSSSK